jgi:hypothetical protein
MAKIICNLNEYPGLSGEGPAAIIKFAKKMEIIKRKEIKVILREERQYRRRN